jgi:hypothetical protein
MSALLGTLGSISAMAQSTNVYSLNAVGYVNVSLQPGYNIISCPLLASPDNTVGTVLNNGDGHLTGFEVLFFNPATGLYSDDIGQTVGGRGGTSNTNGWENNGTNVLSPGLACWIDNPSNIVVNQTFVGTVPSGTMTNVLTKGYNLVSTILPISGDIVTNPLSTLTNFNLGDSVQTYNNPGNLQYTVYTASSGLRGQGGYGYNSLWNAPGDPIVTNVGEGFWYNNAGNTINWVQSFSVNQ